MCHVVNRHGVVYRARMRSMNVKPAQGSSKMLENRESQSLKSRLVSAHPLPAIMAVWNEGQKLRRYLLVHNAESGRALSWGSGDNGR